MNTYKVFFEFLNKKMSLIVKANSKYEAEQTVANKMTIHETRLIGGSEPTPHKYNSGDSGSSDFSDIFGNIFDKHL